MRVLVCSTLLTLGACQQPGENVFIADAAVPSAGDAIAVAQRTCQTYPSDVVSKWRVFWNGDSWTVENKYEFPFAVIDARSGETECFEEITVTG